MTDERGHTLIAHSGAQKVTRAELATIVTPAATRTWRPVAHAELVERVHEGLASRGLAVRRESYAVQTDGALLFAAWDLEWCDNGTYAAALALRHANDKSLAMQMVAGVRVFICDNLALSGDLIVMRRKHTVGLELRDEVARGLDRYLSDMNALEAGIARLAGEVLSPEGAKVRIFDAFERELLPVRCFPHVVANYFEADRLGYPDCAPRTAWGLHNAFTRELRPLPPAPQHRATVGLGRLFGLGRQGEAAS